MTTTVYVWRAFAGSASGARRAGGSWARLSGFIGGFGHVAVRVGDSYLSWWPGEVAGESHSLSYSYEEDLERCGRACDRSISITGLDEKAMIQAWNKATVSAFDEVELNCCTVAGRVLLAGGSGDNLGLWESAKLAARMVAEMPRTWLVGARSLAQDLTVHSPGEIEQLANWMSLVYR